MLILCEASWEFVPGQDPYIVHSAYVHNTQYRGYTSLRFLLALVTLLPVLELPTCWLCTFIRLGASREQGLCLVSLCSPLPPPNGAYSVFAELSSLQKQGSPLVWKTQRRAPCKENLRPGVSLVVQWLRICLQCRGHGFNPWSGR